MRRDFWWWRHNDDDDVWMDYIPQREIPASIWNCQTFHFLNLPSSHVRTLDKEWNYINPLMWELRNVINKGKIHINTQSGLNIIKLFRKITQRALYISNINNYKDLYVAEILKCGKNKVNNAQLFSAMLFVYYHVSSSTCVIQQYMMLIALTMV